MAWIVKSECSAISRTAGRRNSPTLHGPMYATARRGVRDPLKSPGVFRHRAEQYIEAAASGVDKRISQVPLSQRAREDPAVPNLLWGNPSVVQAKAALASGKAAAEAVRRGAAEAIAIRGDETCINEDRLQRRT